MSIHAISRLSPIVSPIYSFYEHGIPTAEQFISSPSDFQSNFASLRTGPTLTGLGIECPDLSTTQNHKHNLYAPFSMTGLFNPLPSLLKRNHQSVTFPKEYKNASVPDWRSSIYSPVLPPGPICVQRDALESNIAQSFRALSAESGLSPDVLATHISASAEIALQILSNSQPNTPYFGGKSEATSTDQHQPSYESQTWPLPFLPTPEMAPPIADINMREWFLANQEAIVGIDPTDTFPGYPLASTSPLLPLPDFFRSPDSSFADVEDNDCDQDVPDSGNEATVGAIHTHSEITSKNTAEGTNLTPPLEMDRLESSPLTELVDSSVKAQDACEDKDPSEYEPSNPGSPSDQDYMPVNLRPRSRRCAKRNITTDELNVSQLEASPLDQTAIDTHSCSDQPKKDETDAKINLGTPVINAHLGITLTELQEKAERYRLRNNIPLSNAGVVEAEFDKRWLLSFVGKLSKQGELIHTFRCYVMGCAQTNKRRDHILIHLGGHLGQRPFKCAECPARFLRKNECKRHEMSHTGERPFICYLCLVGFVRRDLLKRHMNRSHQIEIFSGKRKLDGVEPSKRPSKKTKAR